MIKEVTMYTVVCNNCGKDANKDLEHSCWSDSGFVVEQAVEGGWVEDENDPEKHYCNDCWSWGDDDEILIGKKNTL